MFSKIVRTKEHDRLRYPLVQVLTDLVQHDRQQEPEDQPSRRNNGLRTTVWGMIRDVNPLDRKYLKLSSPFQGLLKTP